MLSIKFKWCEQGNKMFPFKKKKLFLKSHSMWFKVFLQQSIKLCNREQRIWGSETSTQIRWKRVEGAQAFPMENAWAEE